MKALAFAKVNLALIVHPRAADGFHPLRGLFQSVSLADTIEVLPATADEITVSNGEVPSDETNLAWRAVEAVRRASRDSRAISLHISKMIPSGAGLGGGSADAGATIGLLAPDHGIDDELALEIAASLGSDVPFSLTGGTALVRGRGEMVDPIEPLTGFSLAIVVPPFSLSTPDVFSEWDRLGGPVGTAVPDGDLPTVLRGREPIRNDLFPAAVSLDRRVGEWRDQLMSVWGTSVAMTGSGSALFAFFPSFDEARGAIEAVDIPARAAEPVELVDRGWTNCHE
ncbi:MAG: 4-(cytidine 5'-diphospho)-2-C-methyl-D-erythritol kinase [Armatimonadetes bacterium]|nr:MAG: 4-(cytidine 5'-diphospho)-2-C-methyl-D-erythritol kinase [Armatimonadota bacterium]